MTPRELARLRAGAVELARHAGHAILEVYSGDFAVEHKADRSPLTEADLAAHRVIAAGLPELAPGLPVLSEERLAPHYEERRQWRRYWLVDPLDGTREFVKRNGEFTVNIALIEEGDPILGVVFAPVLDELAHAARGAGAELTSRGGRTTVLRVAPRPAPPLRVMGSRSHADGRLGGFLERVGEHELISLGSSLKFCRLAEGGADLYLRYGPTSEWDTAAGQCVLEEAGGSVTDLEGNTLRYNQREGLLNPDFVASADPHGAWRAHL